VLYTQAMMNPDPPSDLPVGAVPAPGTAEQIRSWIGELADQVAAGELGPAELVDELAKARAAGAAYGHAADYLLMAAHEAGASLRQIAPAIGRGYVRAPAARLEKLHRHWLTAADLAADITHPDQPKED
jgi:hypothetical protein